MTTLTASQGWVLLASTAGRWQVDLGSQGPVWLSGVVTSIPAAADNSTFFLEVGGDGVLAFTLESGDKLYGRVGTGGVGQTITVTEIPVDDVSGVSADVAALQASVDALTALIGAEDDATSADTVFGRLNLIVTQTAA